MGWGMGIFGGALQLLDLKGGHDLAAFGVPRLMGISGPGLTGGGHCRDWVSGQCVYKHFLSLEIFHFKRLVLLDLVG